MRTNLFLSTLFAVSLVGGAALANKPGHERPAREPRALESFRSHGDIVDKSYRTADHGARVDTRSNRENVTQKFQRSAAPGDRASSRINCSDTGADCGKSSRPAHEARSGSPFSPAQASKSPLPAAGNERVQCNEADECSMSSKAARKAWAATGAGGNSPTDKPGAAMRSLDERTRMQPSESRMSCNEGDECMMSSKDAKKIWALESVKAGTWHGAQAAADQQQKAAQDKARKDQDRKDQERKEQVSRDQSAVDQAH